MRDFFGLLRNKYFILFVAATNIFVFSVGMYYGNSDLAILAALSLASILLAKNINENLDDDN